MTWEIHNIEMYQIIQSSMKLHRKAGEDALLCLYNGSAKDDLDSLRYERYSEKLKGSSEAAEAHTLPPTSYAARYHSPRVHFQVNDEKWDTTIDAIEWGCGNFCVKFVLSTETRDGWSQ